MFNQRPIQTRYPLILPVLKGKAVNRYYCSYLGVISSIHTIILSNPTFGLYVLIN